MKKGCTVLLLWIGLYSTAQTEKIETNLVNAVDLITYAADYETDGEAQKVYLLVETSATGVAEESRFYIEQAVQLLFKRLEERDKIAIGTYGVVSGVVLPYTQVIDEKAINNGITALLSGGFTPVSRDGIAIAYELASQEADLESTHRIIMVKGSAEYQETAVSSTSLNAYVSIPATTPESKGGTAVITPKTKAEERQEQREQRKQAKAAQHKNLGGAIALTALTILPEILEVIKD